MYRGPPYQTSRLTTLRTVSFYPVPPPPGAPKPSLQGVRNKQRKGVTKANAKFEPLVFRDQLVKHLSESTTAGEGPIDYDAIATKLDSLGNQLDYRKYEQPLFELLLVGRLLAPGGGYADEGNNLTEPCPFSVFTSAKEPVEVNDMKKIVDVFNKLMRRYKYLQKPFEENSLRGILQYTNKFPRVDQDKLAYATALFISSGLASASVLSVLKKDHITKDGTSLSFLTTCFKAYVATESVDHLSASLRKGGITDLTAFFPVTKIVSGDELTAHFKKEGLAGVAEYHHRQRTGIAKEATLERLKELVAEETEREEIEAYLKTQYKESGIVEAEFVPIVWHGLISAVDMTSKPDQLVDSAIKEVQTMAPTLGIFSNKASTEVALINTVQIWCYENTKAMPTFSRILQNLYKQDVISDRAIIYWHEKGAKSQGKLHFLEATAALVKFLREQESDDEEDDE